MKKAELSINLIVIVVIALLILVIIVFLLSDNFGLFRKSTECVSAGGQCTSERECENILSKDLCGPFHVCCSVIE